jgi:Tol biopolymer transport system component
MKRRALLLLPASLLALTGCGDEDPGPDVDATPPAAVEDLTATSPSSERVLLTWTAPGDDHMNGRADRYEIRYSETPITPQRWAAITKLDSLLTPKPAGQVESLAVAATGVRDWYFLLKSADEESNWSAVSNVAAARLGDLTPPGAVTDLSAASTTAQSVTLSWTAPGDDGQTGQATTYEVFFAESPIPPASWTAVPMEPPAPAPAGTVQTFTITGLGMGRSYYFCLRTADEFSNRSVLSNVIASVPGLRRLTTSPGSSLFGAQWARWSPDGLSIAFVADWGETENRDIYAIRAAGGMATRMTMDPAVDSHPCWSPDGQKIAFSSTRGGKDEIWVMEPVPWSEPQLLLSRAEDAFGPAWAPRGGNHIGFVLRTSLLTTAICTDSIVGGAHQDLYDYPAENSYPVWSPDSLHIAFTSDRGGDENIWTVLTEEGLAVRLTFWEGVDAAPSWSPNGARIAFHSDRSGNLDIWTMQADGADPVQLTFDRTSDTYPAWSPDSTKIAFTSRRSGQAEIWIQDLE